MLIMEEVYTLVLTIIGLVFGNFAGVKTIIGCYQYPATMLRSDFFLLFVNITICKCYNCNVYICYVLIKLLL